MTSLNIDQEGNCLLGAYVIHPAGQPLEAACAEMRSLLQNINPDDTLVIFGAGLGWHLKAACSMLKPERIIVFQVLENEKNCCLALGPELPALTWVDNAQDMALALGKRLVYGTGGGVGVFAANAYALGFAPLLGKVKEMIDRGMRRAAKDRQTRNKLSGMWSRHMADNINALLTLPDIILSAGAFKNIPALVAGAGPSLDTSLPLLHEMRNKALVLGAASVLGPMHAKGLKPHVVTALEGVDESRQFVGVDKEQTVLLASLNSNPNHFAMWPGAKAFFHASQWLPSLLNWGGALPSGGHATSAAFTLACLWGCNPIVLVGQDLAYTEGKTHASFRPGVEDEGMEQTIRVPGLNESEVLTSGAMLSYLEWYEEAAAHLRRQYPHIKVINATAAGAKIAGFSKGDLAEIMESLPVMEDPGPKVRLRLANTPLIDKTAVGPRVEEAARLLNSSFASLEELKTRLNNTLLQPWLVEEQIDSGGWRKALAGLRHIINNLKKAI